MKTLRPGYILPSAARTSHSRQLKHYERLDKPPEPGDLVYGRVASIGQHGSLENKYGRINESTRAVFVYGNRYAPDAFEGVVPAAPVQEADVLARSGMIGELRVRNSAMKDPSRVRVLGYVLDSMGKVLNTRNFPTCRRWGNGRRSPSSTT
jgi:hypothetical protein